MALGLCARLRLQVKRAERGAASAAGASGWLRGREQPGDAGALGTAAAAWRGGHAGWRQWASWVALLNMVFVCHGASSCPVLASSSTLDSLAPEPPRPLGGTGGARMISGSLNPPRLGIGGKLLQGVTAGPGGGGEGVGSGVGGGVGGSSTTGGPSALSPGFGDAGNDTHCGEQILSYGNVEKVVIGAALTLITLLTIAGNCLVVISVCFVKKLRQPSNYLIVSLALADLSVAVAVMPFVSVTDLIGGEWIFGSGFCNVFIAMDVMCCTASIMTLCVISIDR